ncbi:DUF3995 domain-containing protein [Stappia stellulata]|uniref:DUF3995 domain-containing protein n=1 Tax=Stappia TaxID=152161 RepID=UPI001CD2F2A9|nr:DUF3995 domain-containing protein [Stappia stellulata]MCA1243038.1 DUF3995 domain-containing protein [Stappia stellulata]
MSILAVALSVILLGIALLHALWGLRVWWPIADEVRLARTVVGERDISHMPAPAACFAVAGAVLAGAALPWLLTHRALLPDRIATLALFAAATFALVFLLRGLAGFTQRFASVFPEEPFRGLDRKYFSPLCLLLGGGFSLLVIWSF